MRQEATRRKNSHLVQKYVVTEALELRRMLSAIPDPQATPVDGAVPLFQAGSGSPMGFSPSQIRSAYGINNITFGDTTGDGSGQTIAIIVAHDNPKFVDSTDSSFNTSDLHLFDQQFGLQDPPSFMKVDQDGGNNYPSTDPGWANEIALDVEWSHAIAPQANILLIESESTNLSNLIEGSAEYAASVPGVSVVTMSFAVSEFQGETSYDSFLASSSANHGVTFIAASGDNGDQGGYPADSPNVLSVGATTLTLSGSNYGSETGRNTSGGGISQDEDKPSYQFGVSQSSTQRTTPDVAFDGDPNTGVSVYDSFNGGSSPWYKVGGTSFSSPAWAGLIAIADQGRASIGLGTLDGASQTLPRLYSLSSSDYHDITSGSNGLSAGPGYDLVTGRGSPIANVLVPDLVGGNSVKGTAFVDSNGNGTQDTGETSLANVTLFTDVYNTGVLEGADQQITSGSDGTFNLSDLPGGTFKIAAVAPAGYRITTSTSVSETGTVNSLTTNKNFGFKATNTSAELKFAHAPSNAVAGTAVSPAITVDVDDSNGGIVLSDNSAVTLSVASGSGTLGGTLTVNAVNGVATFSNVTFSSSDTFTLTASDGSLTAATSSSIAVSGNANTPAGSILAITQQPTDSILGVAISPAIVIDVEDASGSILTTDGSSVTLSVVSGPGSAGGSETVTAKNGVATFSNVTISAAGTYTLRATDGSLAPINTSSFVVNAVPAQLAFSQQPAAANAGAIITPSIILHVEDGSGNVVTTDTSPVTLAIATGTGTLGGTLTVNAVAGVATFSDITVSTAGDFTLAATDGALAPATSSDVNITVPGTLSPVIFHNTIASSLVAGAKLRSSVIVKATADATSTGTVTTNVFATVNGTQTLLGSVTRKQAIKAKKIYAFSIPIKSVPVTLNGSYTLQVETIDSMSHTQTVNGPTIVIAQPFTSLTESITKLTLPPSVIGGAKTRAVAIIKITNAGNINSTGVTTASVYASPDTTILSGELLNSVTRPLTIKPNASIFVTVALTQIPATLTGSLNIISQVTDPNAIRTTNVSSSQLTVGPAFVAVTGTFATVKPVTIALGKFTNLAVILTNSGNTASIGSASLVLGLSADQTTLEPGSTTLTRPLTIPAGKSVTIHLKLIVPATLTSGMYFPLLNFTQGTATASVVGATALSVG